MIQTLIGYQDLRTDIKLFVKIEFIEMLNYYLNNVCRFQVHEDALHKQISCDVIPFIQEVLTNFSYEQGVTLEDNPLTTAFALYRPFRKLCYSIILGKGASVSEKSISDGLEVVVVHCDEIKVREDIVKLGDLIENKDSTLCWSVFVKCANVTFNENVARELPIQFLGLCSILNYWWHSPLIHLAQWELNAFLAQAVSQYAADVASLRRVLVTIVNSRAITLAALLARGAEALLQIASITALPLDPFLPNNYFDGKLFSFYYYLSDQGTSVEKLCDDIPERIEMFKFLMMVIQSDSLVIEDNDEKIETNDIEKKQVSSLSIVPEYEEISDEEDKKCKTEPVTDDELFEEAISSSKDILESIDETKVEQNVTKSSAASDIKTLMIEAHPETKPDQNTNISATSCDLRNPVVESKSELPEPSLNDASSNFSHEATLENSCDFDNQSLIERKDSTSSTVQDLMHLQMISPVSDTGPRFPSFPILSARPISSETKEAGSSEIQSPSTKCLFPINGNGSSEIDCSSSETKNGDCLFSKSHNIDSTHSNSHPKSNRNHMSGGHEPLPPGFESMEPQKNSIDTKIYEPLETESDSKPAIPLPPLPIPVVPQELSRSFPQLHKVSDNELSIHQHPTPTYKRYSDKENHGNTVSGRDWDRGASHGRGNVFTQGAHQIVPSLSSQEPSPPPRPWHPIKRHRSSEGC